MGYIMKAQDFANKAKSIANNYKTLYVMGCFGAPMNAKNKKRYTSNYPYNAQPSRKKMIENASSDTFGFDCICLVKAICWKWSGNKNATYGGAVYKSNGVPDFGSDGVMNYCTGVSKSFKNIVVGEIVHMKGHVGIYIGDGLVVECTPAWKNKVQITACGNIGAKKGYNTRTWTNHGKLKFIDYTTPAPTPTPVQKFKVGDKVIINGPLYVSSNATKATGSVKNKKTTITRYAKGTKHPYNTTGDLGWMDTNSIKLQ